MRERVREREREMFFSSFDEFINEYVTTTNKFVLIIIIIIIIIKVFIKEEEEDKSEFQ